MAGLPLKDPSMDDSQNQDPKFNKPEIWESNRDMAKRPKKGYKYCYSCDGCLVGDGQKCGWCGSLDGAPQRNKKAYR